MQLVLQLNLEDLKTRIPNNDDLQEPKNIIEEIFDEENHPEMFESKDSGLNDSCATDASLLEIALAQKEDEIKQLKSEMNQKDEVIERQRIQTNRIERRYFEASNNLETIKKLVIGLDNQGHILSTIDQIRQEKEIK